MVSTQLSHLYLPQWYIVLGTYGLAPLLAIINAYTAGLTDVRGAAATICLCCQTRRSQVNMANLYNKLAIFLFAMAGGSEGGITTGLAMSGVIMASVTASCEIMQVCVAGPNSLTCWDRRETWRVVMTCDVCDICDICGVCDVCDSWPHQSSVLVLRRHFHLLQDFRAGYLTYTSTTAMVVGQVLGALAGTIISPVIYQVYKNAFPIGVAGGPYPAPYADQSRAMALVGAQGVSVLPKNTAWYVDHVTHK